MLYNVLPPLAFFVSLGGIILVVSRVVVRVRREEWEANVKQQFSALSATAKKKTDLAAVVGPNQKSVRSFKNRVALVTHWLRQAAADTVAFITNAPGHVRAYTQNKKRARQERKAERKAKKLQTTMAIVPPRSTIRERLESLNTSRQRAVQAWNKRRESRRQQKLQHTPPQVSQFASLKKTAPSTSQSSKPAQQKRVDDNQNKVQTRPAVNISKLFHKENKKPTTPLAKAKAACKRRDYEEAEDILIPHLMKYPRDTKAYMLLGLIATRRKSWDEAVEIYDQVVKINPETPRAWAALGRAAYEGGKMTRAIEALQRAHDADPTDIATIERLLTIARRMDNTAMQHTLIEQLKELNVN